MSTYESRPSNTALARGRSPVPGADLSPGRAGRPADPIRLHGRGPSRRGAGRRTAGPATSCSCRVGVPGAGHLAVIVDDGSLPADDRAGRMPLGQLLLRPTSSCTGDVTDVDRARDRRPCRHRLVAVGRRSRRRRTGRAAHRPLERQRMGSGGDVAQPGSGRHRRPDRERRRQRHARGRRDLLRPQDRDARHRRRPAVVHRSSGDGRGPACQGVEGPRRRAGTDRQLGARAGGAAPGPHDEPARHHARLPGQRGRRTGRQPVRRVGGAAQPDRGQRPGDADAGPRLPWGPHRLLGVRRDEPQPPGPARAATAGHRSRPVDSSVSRRAGLLRPPARHETGRAADPSRHGRPGRLPRQRAADRLRRGRQRAARSAGHRRRCQRRRRVPLRDPRIDHPQRRAPSTRPPGRAGRVPAPAGASPRPRSPTIRPRQLSRLQGQRHAETGEDIFNRQCGFFPPAGGEVTEATLRRAVAAAANAEQEPGWTPAAHVSSTRRTAGSSATSCGTSSPPSAQMRPSTLVHAQTAATSGTVNYATFLASVHASRSECCGGGRPRPAAGRSTPIQAAPANLDSLVERKLKEARESRSTRAWKLGLRLPLHPAGGDRSRSRTDAGGKHQGRDVLLRSQQRTSVLPSTRRTAGPDRSTARTTRSSPARKPCRSVTSSSRTADRARLPTSLTCGHSRRSRPSASSTGESCTATSSWRSIATAATPSPSAATSVAAWTPCDGRPTRSTPTAARRGAHAAVHPRVDGRELVLTPGMHTGSGLPSTSTARIFALLSPVPSCVIVPSPLFGGPAA